MNPFHRRWLTTTLILSLMFGVPPGVNACTGIRVTAKDGSVIRARTMEFGLDLESEVLVVPRGFDRTGTTPRGADGMRWKSKYASVGANGVGLPYVFDGLNEKGLAVGLFYFPTTAQYQAFDPSKASQTLAPWELGSWILENFASVSEVRQSISNVVTAEVVFPSWGFVPPAHYVVYDASGQSIVIEYVGGRLQVHDNPLGVMSNSPAFDWHMTNLRNYVNLSVNSHPPVQVGSVTLAPFGQGSGMLGIPGDFTPPSRFVRAVAYSTSLLPPATGADAVLEAFHILNNFDIPKGAARDGSHDAKGNITVDYTLWTSVCDLRTRQFFFMTYENSQLRSVDLMKMPLDGAAIVHLPMKGNEVIRSLVP